jgi:hypothetical protein
MQSDRQSYQFTGIYRSVFILDVENSSVINFLCALNTQLHLISYQIFESYNNKICWDCWKFVLPIYMYNDGVLDVNLKNKHPGISQSIV